MRQIINASSATGVAGPNPKVTAAIDMAKELLAAKRAASCSAPTAPRSATSAGRWTAESIGGVGIRGPPPADRIENKRTFQNPTDVVVCTIQAGAESWSASPTATWLISTAYVYACVAVSGW